MQHGRRNAAVSARRVGLTWVGAVLLLGLGSGCPASGTPGPYCGDGVVDLGESCDDGNETGCDGCSISCYLEGCGNGIVECGEDCDDGNIINGDGCSSTCVDEEDLCGNGTVDYGEACDDGNAVAGDGCAPDCTVEPGPECGDGTAEGTEECDDGNTDDCDGCSSICRSEACGNGTLECTEECDDANNADGDGCAADCTTEVAVVCGDGTMAGTEACDDGNTDDCDGCSATCAVEACGNATLECAEGCDDGNVVAGDGCAADCTVEIPAGCGNGVLDSGEECDDGNTVSGDGCQANCMDPACGDGILDTGEACDDGNAAGGDGCSATCDIEAYTHTIAIDGGNDFTAAESFATSSGGFSGYVSWDSSALYIGFLGADVSANSPTRWLLVYLSGGANTTTTGVTYNTQGPSLPYAAGYHLRWRTDDLYTDLQNTDGATWSSITWSGSSARNGDFVELSIPLADLGSPTSLSVHLSMINEQGGNEWSWASVPDSSFSDGVDPDYTRYYDFDLTGAADPSSYTPLP